MQVYKITHKVTGMSYIGVTKTPLAERLRGHHSMATKGLDSPLSVAIRRDGWEAFDASTIAFCDSLAEAHERERAAIIAFGTLVPNGYNRALGGPGNSAPVSRETRSKISAANTGKRYIYTPEWREKIVAKGAERRGAANIRARAVSFQGVEYPSITDAMAATGLTREQFNYRLKKGVAAYVGLPKLTLPVGMGKWNLGKLHKGGARPSTQGGNNWRARQIMVGGTVYPSATDAVKATGLSIGQIRVQLARGEAKYLSASRFIN